MTSSIISPDPSQMVPNFMVYPFADDMLERRQLTTLSAMVRASGPLILMTEIAPVPGTVAGAKIVSSFLMYICKRIFDFPIAKLP